jgi:WD40 repeat protein
MKVSESEILRLESSNTRLMRDNTHLQIEIDQLRSKLKSARDHMASTESISAFSNIEIPEVDSICHPAIVCERRVRDGFRLCITQGQIVVSSAADSGYGFQIVPLHSPTESSFVPVHSQQIRDVADMGTNSLIASASLDRTLAFTSLETQTVTNRFDFDVGLWCVSAMDANVFGTGGDRGRLYFGDIRSGTEVIKLETMGPPVNSIVRLSDELALALTARNSYVYDFRRGSTVIIKKEIEGGIAVRGCPASSFYAVLSRKESSSEVSFCTFDDQQRKFNVFSTQQIGYVKSMARPALQIVNGIVHCAVPNEPSCDFSLFALSQSKHDLWLKCKERWGAHKNRTPVVDLAMVTDPASILISALTSETLTLYQVPLA